MVNELEMNESIVMFALVVMVAAVVLVVLAVVVVLEQSYQSMMTMLRLLVVVEQWSQSSKELNCNELWQIVPSLSFILDVYVKKIK